MMNTPAAAAADKLLNAITDATTSLQEAEQLLIQIPPDIDTGAVPFVQRAITDAIHAATAAMLGTGAIQTLLTQTDED